MDNEKLPLEKDQLIKNDGELTASPSISENNFIRNEPFVKSFPFWLWLILAALLVVLILGIKTWYSQVVDTAEKSEPFLEVTNREFSVFLWQFPNFLRSNVSKKTGYMTGFMFDRENFDPEKGEDFVSAPPDLIFLYHTWNRLLASDFIANEIKPEEFDAFLKQLPEWEPKNWKKASEGYVKLIESKAYLDSPNMENLSESELPLIVRQAFQGWKNYFMEGSEINELKPTINEVSAFIKKHPTYARPFWRNISKINGKEVAGLNYLQFLLEKNTTGNEKVPENQLASFLKVGLYNEDKKKK